MVSRLVAQGRYMRPKPATQAECGLSYVIAEVVGAVDHVLQGLRALVGVGVQLASPVPAGVPVSAANTRHVETRDQADVRIVQPPVPRHGTRAHIVKAKASTGPVDGGQRWTRNFSARFFIERVVFGKRNHGRIFSGRTQRVLLHQGLLVLRGQVGDVARLHVAVRRVDVGHGRSFRH